MIKRKWHSIKDCMPPEDTWVVVRCINKESTDFYYTAQTFLGGWNFFDDDLNNNDKLEKELQITHWCKELKPKKDHEYIRCLDPEDP